MTSINKHLSQLCASATFADMVKNKLVKKIDQHQQINSQRKIHMMAWGDTSYPLPSSVVNALVDAATQLGDWSTYTGYGEFEGHIKLREAIAKRYYQHLSINITVEEVFISDGAQSATFGIQELFGRDNVIALQDPIYPPFLEANLLVGRNKVKYLACNEENGFVPEPPTSRVDIIYLCFPNNPTGAVATKEQLKAFVDYARTHDAIIIFDAVYSAFITDPDIPRSIYEIEDAAECAIEIGSFSKMAGFSGLRLGWAVVPLSLRLEKTQTGGLTEMYKSSQAIRFWGASNLAQQGGIAALSQTAQQDYQNMIKYYLDNAKILKEGLESYGMICFGGKNNPYIWIKSVQQMDSWQVFNTLLSKANIVGVPGSLFGSGGEGFLRLSAMGEQRDMNKAIEGLSLSLKS